jgi:hypothetical protein
MAPKALREIGIGTIAIMPNDTEAYREDSFDNMKVFAAKHGFMFPYVLDRTQEVARAYDAQCTPDFFGFNAQDELQYRGRLDASRMTQVANARRDLFDAMTQVTQTGHANEASALNGLLDQVEGRLDPHGGDFSQPVFCCRWTLRRSLYTGGHDILSRSKISPARATPLLDRLSLPDAAPFWLIPTLWPRVGFASRQLNGSEISKAKKSQMQRTVIGTLTARCVGARPRGRDSVIPQPNLPRRCQSS